MEMIFFQNLMQHIIANIHNHSIIQELNNSYYNCTDGTDDALRYDIIKYNKKKEILLLLIEIEL